MAELRKYINASYKTLAELLGEPTSGRSDDEKTWATWEFNFDEGWGEIYDYKSYAPRVEDVTEWHVTADNEAVMERINEKLYKE